MPGNIFFTDLRRSRVGGQIAARGQNRPQSILYALASFFTKEGIPHSGEKGGLCQPPKRGSGGAHGGVQTNTYNLRRACRRRKSRHRKSPQSGVFRCPPRRGGVLNSEGKKDKTEAIHRIRVAKHASAASADTRRSLGPEGRAGFAPRTWARSGHCRYLPKKRGE